MSVGDQRPDALSKGTTHGQHGSESGNGVFDSGGGQHVRVRLAQAGWVAGRESQRSRDWLVSGTRATSVVIEIGEHKIDLAKAEIGELVLAELRPLSEVAYIRFASVYRQFQGIRDFVDTLHHLNQGRNQK